ncbi:hypothetical protein CF326_g6568 [Tilletia indica]|nr:hypothetical protein CF326_g6568 [Tilletia indica]
MNNNNSHQSGSYLEMDRAEVLAMVRAKFAVSEDQPGQMAGKIKDLEHELVQERMDSQAEIARLKARLHMYRVGFFDARAAGRRDRRLQCRRDSVMEGDGF